MENNQNIKVASEQLEQISEDEINQRIAELREKARRDDVANRLTGERIGREKAEKEFEERLREQIHKMIYFCLSISQIAEISGLSVEEIEKLSNN